MAKATSQKRKNTDLPSGRTMRLANGHGMNLDAIDLKPLPAFSGGLGAGEMFGLSNEAMLTEETYSEALTGYSIGYVDPENNQALVNYLAPNVQAGRIFEIKRFNNAQEFYTENNDIRAVGAEFKRIEYSGETVFQNTLNKGLGFRYDMDYISKAGIDKGTYLEDPVRFQKRIVAKIKRRKWRNEAIRTVTLALASAVNTGVTWTSGTPNPMADMRGILDTAQLVSGLYNNRMLVAKDAWSTLQSVFEDQNNPLGYRYQGKTPQQIAEALLLDQGMVSKAVYQSSAAAKSRIITNVVLFFLALEGADDEDPSNLKRFWTPCEGGTEERVYVNEYGKFTDIFVEDYSRVVAVTPDGMAKATVS